MNLSFKNQLLCDALKAQMHGRSFVWPSGLPEGFWDELMAEAEDQGLFFLLGSSLLEGMDLYGDMEAKEKCAVRLKGYENRSFQLSIKLLKILGLLQAEGIVAVPVKGPLLAEYLYGDVAKRTFADLDIFIYEKDLFSAVEILEKAGYSPELKLSSREMKKFSNQEYDFKLYDAKSHTIVELHWELSGRYTKKPMILEDYAGRLEKASVLGKVVDKLPDSIDFIYLCLHSAKHCFERFEMLYAIAIYYQKFSEEELDALLEIVSSMKCRKIFLFSLYMCHRLLGLDLSGHITSESARYSYFDTLVCRVLYFIENRHDLSDTRFSTTHIRLQDSVLLRGAFIFRLIFTPTCKEWHLFRLPYRLTFLYRWIRPFRLAVAYAQKRLFAKTSVRTGGQR